MGMGKRHNVLMFLFMRMGGRWGEGSKKQGKSKADVGGSRGRKDAREPCAVLIKLLRHDARKKKKNKIKNKK